MISKKKVFWLRFINAIFFIALIYIQYNSVFSLKIAQANPMLPIALLVAVCMFCSEITAAISGVIVGIFIDTTAATPQGFNAIMFLFLGLAVSLIVRHLFNNNIMSAVALCALCCLFYLLVRWIIGFVFDATFSENLTYLLQSILPSVLYTTVFSIPFYFLEKTLYSKFYK